MYLTEANTSHHLELSRMDHDDCDSASKAAFQTTTFLVPDAPPPEADDEAVDVDVDEVRPEYPPEDGDEDDDPMHLQSTTGAQQLEDAAEDDDWPLPNHVAPAAITDVSGVASPSRAEGEDVDDGARLHLTIAPAFSALEQHSAHEQHAAASDASEELELPPADAETESQPQVLATTPSSAPAPGPAPRSGSGGPGKQECSLCHKQFANVYRLERHRLSHLEGDELRRFRCNSCNKAFKVTDSSTQTFSCLMSCHSCDATQPESPITHTSAGAILHTPHSTHMLCLVRLHVPSGRNPLIIAHNQRVTCGKTIAVQYSTLLLKCCRVDCVSARKASGDPIRVVSVYTVRVLSCLYCKLHAMQWCACAACVVQAPPERAPAHPLGRAALHVPALRYVIVLYCTAPHRTAPHCRSPLHVNSILLSWKLCIFLSAKTYSSLTCYATRHSLTHCLFFCVTAHK